MLEGPVIRSMPRQRKVLLQTFLALLIGLVVFLVTSQTRPLANQPSYKGLQLAQWLDVVARHRENGYGPVITSQPRQPAKDATPEQIHEAEEAVRGIGTNALPFLLAWINPKPNLVKIIFRGALDLLPLPEHTRGFLWGIPGTKDEGLQEFALHGFRVLSTNALPAVAELSKLANDTNHPWAQKLAVKSLSTITNAHPQ
jgi:hypothetical protein